MPKLGRPHDWHTGFVMYNAYEFCGRCGARKETAPRDCLSDAELAERAAWNKEAERAAELMGRSKFGGASLLCDGSGDYITADRSDFTLGSGDWTVELMRIKSWL